MQPARAAPACRCCVQVLRAGVACRCSSSRVLWYSGVGQCRVASSRRGPNIGPSRTSCVSSASGWSPKPMNVMTAAQSKLPAMHDCQRFQSRMLSRPVCGAEPTKSEHQSVRVVVECATGMRLESYMSLQCCRRGGERSEWTPNAGRPWLRR